MKYALLTLGLGLALSAQAQTEGSITYTDTRKLTLNFGGDMPEEMLAQIPKERSVTRELLFTESAALYRNAPKSDDTPQNISHSGGDVEVEIKMVEPENVVYRDLTNANMVEQREWMGQRFLVMGKAEQAWKVTTEQKMVQGYPCLKATTVVDSTEVVAWFTAQIPVSIGPANYGGLPGAILEVNEDDGQRVLTASAIKLGPVEEEFKRPRGGKKMSREEFQEFQEEKIAEMREMNGGQGGGGVFIIREGGE